MGVFSKISEYLDKMSPRRKKGRQVNFDYARTLAWPDDQYYNTDLDTLGGKVYAFWEMYRNPSEPDLWAIQIQEIIKYADGTVQEVTKPDVDFSETRLYTIDAALEEMNNWDHYIGRKGKKPLSESVNDYYVDKAIGSGFIRRPKGDFVHKTERYGRGQRPIAELENKTGQGRSLAISNVQTADGRAVQGIGTGVDAFNFDEQRHFSDYIAEFPEIDEVVDICGFYIDAQYLPEIKKAYEEIRDLKEQPPKFWKHTARKFDENLRMKIKAFENKITQSAMNTLSADIANNGLNSILIDKVANKNIFDHKVGQVSSELLKVREYRKKFEHILSEAVKGLQKVEGAENFRLDEILADKDFPLSEVQGYMVLNEDAVALRKRQDEISKLSIELKSVDNKDRTEAIKSEIAEKQTAFNQSIENMAFDVLTMDEKTAPLKPYYDKVKIDHIEILAAFYRKETGQDIGHGYSQYFEKGLSRVFEQRDKELKRQVQVIKFAEQNFIVPSDVAAQFKTLNDMHNLFLKSLSHIANTCNDDGADGMPVEDLVFHRSFKSRFGEFVSTIEYLAGKQTYEVVDDIASFLKQAEQAVPEHIRQEILAGQIKERKARTPHGFDNPNSDNRSTVIDSAANVSNSSADNQENDRVPNRAYKPPKNNSYIKEFNKLHIKNEIYRNMLEKYDLMYKEVETLHLSKATEKYKSEPWDGGTSSKKRNKPKPKPKPLKL